MLPQVEKPKITEIQVRMDCNGCVQKIKKALHGINGIYDVYIDFPQQKITIIGWADPEKIIKAIKKTRKSATICLHTEPTESPQAQPTEPAPPEAANPPPTENPPAETPKDHPPPTPPPPQPQAEQQQKDSQPAESAPPPPPPPEVKPSTPASDAATANQPPQPSGPKDVEEVHIIYHHPPDYRNRYGYGDRYSEHWNAYPNGPRFRHEPPQPIHVTHSYNTHKPSPYVTEYEYFHSPPQNTYYSRPESYNGDYYRSGYNSSGSGNGNITSIFSDENPNACTIS